jgi:hypothetical protein
MTGFCLSVGVRSSDKKNAGLAGILRGFERTMAILSSTLAQRQAAQLFLSVLLLPVAVAAISGMSAGDAQCFPVRFVGILRTNLTGGRHPHVPVQGRAECRAFFVPAASTRPEI